MSHFYAVACLLSDKNEKCRLGRSLYIIIITRSIQHIKYMPFDLYFIILIRCSFEGADINDRTVSDSEIDENYL
jgi:hypothetical protein